MKHCILTLGFLHCLAICYASEMDKVKYSTEENILKVGVVTTMEETSGDIGKDMSLCRLIFESSPVEFGGQKGIMIRVWGNGICMWPGDNSQIIQVVDKNNKVVSAGKIGGEPIAQNIWVAYYFGRLFVNIKCAHRRGQPHGTYIYEISKDFLITPSGIHFDAEDIEENNTALQFKLKEVLERMKNRPDNPGLERSVTPANSP